MGTDLTALAYDAYFMKIPDGDRFIALSDVTDTKQLIETYEIQQRMYQPVFLTESPDLYQTVSQYEILREKRTDQDCKASQSMVYMPKALFSRTTTQFSHSIRK